MMNPDEMLALMAASIYAARLSSRGGTAEVRAASAPWRVAAMEASVEDAVTLWGFMVARKPEAAE